MDDSILSSTLLFNPALRVSVEGALADKWASEFHKSEGEPVYPNGPIRIVVSDNTKLSAADYRNNLHTQITAINKGEMTPHRDAATRCRGRNRHTHQSLSDRRERERDGRGETLQQKKLVCFEFPPKAERYTGVPRVRLFPSSESGFPDSSSSSCRVRIGARD